MKITGCTAVMALSFLLVGGMLVFGEEPLLINSGFEKGGPQSSESGRPEVLGWQFYRWGTSGDSSAIYGISDKEACEGKQSAFVSAVLKDAVGWISNPIVLTDEMHKHVKIQARVKRSPDYAGNVPWIFVSWCRHKEFLGRVNVAVESVGPDEWGNAILKINPTDIPEGADSFRINLATLRGGMSGAVLGLLYFDDVKVTTDATGAEK